MNHVVRIASSDPADLMWAAAGFLFDAEQKLKLFDLRLHGVQVWPLMRLSVFNAIIRDLKLFSETGSFLPTKPGFRQRMALALADPRLSHKRRPTIVVDGSFLYAVDGEMRDVYTYEPAAGFPEGTVEFVDLGREQQRTKSGQIRFSGENLLLSESVRRRLIAKYFSRKLAKSSEEVRGVLAALDKQILDAFGVTISTYSYAFGQAVHQEAMYGAWCGYFKQRRPENVVLGVQSYGYEGMIRAAHEAGARVSEFQHGMVHKAHLAYHFPGAPSIDHAPDVFLAFGPGWRTFGDLPGQSKYVSFGFPFLSLMRDKLAKQIANKSEMIAVLASDPFHAHNAIDAIRVLRRTGMPIVLRPHPSDRFDYRATLDRFGLGDVEVASAKVPAYELLAKCEFAVSGSSTVLFEAMMMGCKTISLPFGYRKFVEPLLAGTAARIVTDIENLTDTLADAQRPGSMAFYFEEKPKNILSAISA